MEMVSPPTQRGTPSRDEQVTEMYRTYAPALFRFLLGLAQGDRQLAEDLTQETLLRAWQHREHLPTAPEHLRRWLFTVARRIAIDAARSRRARPIEIGSIDLSTLADDDQTIERLSTVHDVLTALEALSPKHRQILLEVYFRGHTGRTAAQTLGIPEGTVRSRTHHALRALRNALEPRTQAPLDYTKA